MILINDKLPKEPAQLATVQEANDIIKKLEWELQHSSIPGIGLSAIQVGIQKAVAIVRIKNPFTGKLIAVNLVNPILIEAHDIIQYEEGCLSFPGQSAKTVRYNEVVIETNDDYEGNITENRRLIQFGEIETDESEIRKLQQLVCVCCQHEMAHNIALTMHSFAPKEVGRNDQCPCGSGKKNKKCCDMKYFNNNLLKLYKPNYRPL